MNIIAIDQSTSATKGLLYDGQGRAVASASLPHRQIYPRPGYVEHDPEEIADHTARILNTLLNDNGLSASDIAAVGLSNQRETVVLWDAVTGQPVCNAIVWQCARAAELCAEIAKEGVAELVRERTGLTLSPYFSAAKIAWALRHADGAAQLAQKGRLRVGTIDSWLVFKLTGGAVHATDYSNASRMQLLNLRTLDWDDDLLKLFGIPRSALPELRMSDAGFGQAKVAGGSVSIAAAMGDSHAALFGQNCFRRGDGKATYGTGSSVMMNTGSEIVSPSGGLVSSIAWGLDGQVSYAVEGNINSAGVTLRWLCDIGLLSSPADAGTIASSLEGNGGVYLVPAFTGLGAPHWDSACRAALMGMSFATGKEHIARAAEESIAYQVRDIVEPMSAACGETPKELRVDGGPTRDAFLMQFQADILGIPVSCAADAALSAYGACLMAGKAAGVWGSLEQLSEMRQTGVSYQPGMKDAERRRLQCGWEAAVRAARGFSVGGL